VDIKLYRFWTFYPETNRCERQTAIVSNSFLQLSLQNGVGFQRRKYSFRIWEDYREITPKAGLDTSFRGWGKKRLKIFLIREGGEYFEYYGQHLIISPRRWNLELFGEFRARVPFYCKNMHKGEPSFCVY
jgi:hypothetical protein